MAEARTGLSALEILLLKTWRIINVVSGKKSHFKYMFVHFNKFLIILCLIILLIIILCLIIQSLIILWKNIQENYIFHEVEHFAKQTAKAIADASGLYGKLYKK